MSDDEDVMEPWAADADAQASSEDDAGNDTFAYEGIDVRDMTHVDLDESRTRTSKLSTTQNGGERVHRLVETVRQHEGLEAASAAVDRALRVELAAALDSHTLPVTREQYDVAYLIPPQGWIGRRTFSEVELVAEGDVDTEGRWVSYSTAPTVYEMAQEVVDESLYESVTAMAVRGLERLLGRH
jgi:hypothetical protein